MKLLMIIVDSECREEVEVLFKRNGVTGYSEIPNAHGVGATGIRMGSGAHPKTSSLFFTIVEADKVAPLKKALCTYCDACERHMRMVQWGVEADKVAPLKKALCTYCDACERHMRMVQWGVEEVV